MNLSPLPIQKFFSNDGRPLVGGKLFTYAAGTSNKIATWKDSSGTSQNTNPVILDFRGEANVWLDPLLSYKFVLSRPEDTDPPTNPIWSVDNIEAGLTIGVLTQQFIGQILYPRTQAEINAGVTPSDYSVPHHIAASGIMFAKRYGILTSNTDAQNNAAFARATSVMAFASGGILQLGAGEYLVSETIQLGSCQIIRGVTNGYGVNSSTVLRWEGANDVCVQVGTPGSSATGLFCGVELLTIKNAGTGTYGIMFSSVHGFVRRVTITGQTNVGWSSAAIGTDPAYGTYALFLTECYLVGNDIGFNPCRGIDFKCVDCYFEGNGTNCRIGDIAQVTSFMFTGGENVLFGVGYLGNTAERTDSIGMDVVNCLAFVLENASNEADGGAIVGSEAQRAVHLKTCHGAVIKGNHFYGANLATGMIELDDDSQGTVIHGNEFAQINGYAVQFQAGATFDIGMNVNLAGSCTGVWDNTWTPVPTGLAVVNGTGGATYSGTWDRKGNLVFWQIKVTVTGTATTASTAGTTQWPIGSMMPNVAREGTCVAVNTDVTSYGVGYQSNSTSKIFSPTWSAVNRNIIIRGSYETADPQ